MHSAAGANALDDLLAEVAALGEVQRAGLAGLLGQIAFAEVDAVTRRSFEHAHGFGCAQTAGDGAGGEQHVPEHADVLVGAPELETRRRGGIAAGKLHGYAADAGLHKPESVWCCSRQGDPEGGEQLRSAWTGNAERGSGGGDVLEGNVVHDDEVVEVRHEGGNLAAIGEDEQLVGKAEGVAVALDAALRVEHKAIVSCGFGQSLNVIGEHSVEPAETICAADGELPAIAEIEGTGAFRQGGDFLSRDAEDGEAAGAGQLLKRRRSSAECRGECRGAAHSWDCRRVLRGSDSGGRSVLHSGKPLKNYSLWQQASGRHGDGEAMGMKARRATCAAMAAGLLAALPLRAQSTGAPAPQQNGPAQQAQPQQNPSQPKTDQKITSAQAKELFASVDQILSFASKDSDLSIRHAVKRRLTTRDEVQHYILGKMKDDKDAQRLQSSEIVLKKFGLLDRDFHLRPFMVSLLTEQIAGYYDSKTKTVNMLDWIAPDDQKPVLAHELTHALQDQHVDLEKWSDQSKESTAKNVAEDNKHLPVDEADTAREAVAEGQAMAVFLDWGLKPKGQSLAKLPDIAAQLDDLGGDDGDSPVLKRAPLLLKESLLFPYREGLNFEQTVLKDEGPKEAFAGVLDRPPGTSYEIMHPRA